CHAGACSLYRRSCAGFYPVMRGLYPRIHPERICLFMDCRGRRQVYVVCARQTIMPGNDSTEPMPARLFLSSGDLMADRRFEFARDLQIKGDLPAAADLLVQAIELAPNFTSAWFTLGGIREELGEHEAAVAAFRNAQASDSSDR